MNSTSEVNLQTDRQTETHTQTKREENFFLDSFLLLFTYLYKDVKRDADDRLFSLVDLVTHRAVYLWYVEQEKTQCNRNLSVTSPMNLPLSEVLTFDRLKRESSTDLFCLVPREEKETAAIRDRRSMIGYFRSFAFFLARWLALYRSVIDFLWWSEVPSEMTSKTNGRNSLYLQITSVALAALSWPLILFFVLYNHRLALLFFVFLPIARLTLLTHKDTPAFTSLLVDFFSPPSSSSASSVAHGSKRKETRERLKETHTFICLRSPSVCFFEFRLFSFPTSNKNILLLQLLIYLKIAIGLVSSVTENKRIMR